MISSKYDFFSKIFSLVAILRGIKIIEYKFEIINNMSNAKIKLLLGEKDIYLKFFEFLLLSSSESEDSNLLLNFFIIVKVSILSFISFLILFLIFVRVSALKSKLLFFLIGLSFSNAGHNVRWPLTFMVSFMLLKSLKHEFLNFLFFSCFKFICYFILFISFLRLFPKIIKE